MEAKGRVQQRSPKVAMTLKLIKSVEMIRGHSTVGQIRGHTTAIGTVGFLEIEKKRSSMAVSFVGNARALSKDLWATRRVVHQVRQNP
jgi:hypothetical protein